MLTRLGVVAVLSAVLVFLSCARKPLPSLPAPAVDAEKPADFPGLHNVVTYSPGVYSGSAPEGDKGFDTLAAMGIRTIISVDGATPEVQQAKDRGMKYVHLPIGYNGMDKPRTLEIAKAVRDLPHPVYIHCHHGKHRSAGAAGAAAVTLGWLTPEQAVARMRVSGTAPSYKGLYMCVNVASVAEAAEIDQAISEFPETWKTSGMVQTMVEVDAAFEHLKDIEKAGWKTPPNHPDLVPIAEAGRLADLLRNLQDDEYSKAQPDEFTKLLLTSSREVEELEAELSKSTPDPAKLGSLLKVVTASCKNCHTQYRD